MKKLVVGLAVMAVAALALLASHTGPATPASAAHNVYTVAQDGFGPVPITPLGDGTIAVANFYLYSALNPCFASANTPLGLEISETSQLFLYDGVEGVSLVVIHDKPGQVNTGPACVTVEEPESAGSADFDFSGVPAGAGFLVRDDPIGQFSPPDTYADPPAASASWSWGKCCTDGGAIGLLECPFVITITPTSAFAGIDTWIARSGPTGASIETFPNLTEPVTITCNQVAHVTVTTTDDELNSDGDCSLREAIQAANTNVAVDLCPAGSAIVTDIIDLPAGTYTLTIAGAGENANATGDLDITGDLTISGAGAGTTTVQAGPTPGSGIDRVFHILGGPPVEITGLTIRNGSVTDSAGGGIFNGAGATLTLNSSTVSGNTSVAAGPFPDPGFSVGGGIGNQGTLTLTNVTVSGNTADAQGGILNDTIGTLTVNSSTVRDNSGDGIGNAGTAELNNSTVSGNSGVDGGGILNGGPLTVNNSTISGNSASIRGGGIFTSIGGTLTLNSSTVSGNTAVSGGGGIFIFVHPSSGTPILKNTIVANSTPGGDCSGPITSAGHNLIENTAGCTITGDTTGNIIGSDPLLGPLADNGGPTKTHALLAGSPAIDAGNPATPGIGGNACEATDQRGVTRPLDGDFDDVAICDIGAFELAVFNSTYEASSGLFPDQVCPPWELVDTAPENPTLSAGNLILSTSFGRESDIMVYRQGYEQPIPFIAVSDPLIIEANMRLESGFTASALRAPAAIVFAISPSEGNALFIGAGEIFLITDGVVKGPSASLDTEVDPHTYRIEVSGFAGGGSGSIKVFYDNFLKLEGSTFFSVGFNDDVGARVAFGDETFGASGTSEWKFVRHNASTVPDSDGDGIEDSIDRALDGSDRSNNPSNDTFNDGTTFGIIEDRAGWGVCITDLPSAGVQAEISGSGGPPGALIDTCGVDPDDRERTILDVAGEIAEITCDAPDKPVGSTTVLTAKANDDSACTSPPAPPATIELRKPPTGVAVLVCIPETFDMTIGSPITADPSNTGPVLVQIVNQSDIPFGLFQLAPGQAADVDFPTATTATVTNLGPGTATVTVSGVTVVLSPGESQTFDLVPPVGGTVELLGQSESPADASGSSARDYTAPIAAAVAVGALALAAGSWYARRRWLR